MSPFSVILNSMIKLLLKGKGCQRRLYGDHAHSKL